MPRTGKYCRQAGIRIEDLENEKFTTLPEKLFTNGVVLELYAYCRIRHISKEVLLKWIIGISPKSVDYRSEGGKVLRQIQVLHGRRDFLRKRKADSALFKDLEGCPFAVPSDPAPSESLSEYHQMSSSDINASSLLETLPLLSDSFLEAVLIPSDSDNFGLDASFSIPGLLDDMPEVNVPFPKEFPAPMSTTEEYPPDDFAQSENLPPLDIQAEVDSQAATTRVPLSEKEKELNSLSYLMSVKQRTVAQLNSEISDLQTKLKEQGERNVHYQKKYVNLREASKNKTIENLRAKVKILQNQKKTYISQTDKKLGKKNSDIAALQERIAQLERDLTSMSQRARREQRLKSYYKTLPSVAKVRKSRTGQEFSKLNNYIKVLEDRLLQTENNGQTLIDTKGEDGTFSDDVRLAVIELLGLEVAVHKVSPVIQAVAKHVFKHKFKPCDLPSRMTVLRISDEGQYLTKCLYADKLHACSHFGENKDGTSRKKVKYLETTLTMDTGETCPLGFRRIAKEDAETVAKTSQLEIEELCSVSMKSTETETGTGGGGELDCDIFKVDALSKLSYFMSDRAATEKKANELMNNWVQEELTKADAPATIVHSMYCMAHVLLGFHRYSEASLKELQTELIAEGGKIGRDDDGAYFRFKTELAVTRIVRMVSEILGPNVDEKSGVRDKWLADLSSRQKKSIIGDYRDNRFNGLFWLASQIMVHIDDILGLEKRLKSPNLKVRSVFLDLKDSRLVTMVQAVGIVYVKITEPYWRLVTSKEVSYLDLHLYIKPMLRKVEIFMESPEDLLIDDKIIPNFKSDKEDVLYQAVMSIRHNDRKDLLLRTISTVMGAFSTCIRKQLDDFIKGTYSENAAPSEKARTSGSGLNNLVSERNFGSLDASCKRRRHATIHFHSSVLLLKTNRQKLVDWLMNKPERKRRALLKQAKTQGKWLRMKHQEEEKIQKKKEEDELVVVAEKKKQAAQKLLRKAKEAAAKGKKIRNNPAVGTGNGTTKKLKSRPKKRQYLPPPPEAVTSVKKDDWVAVAYENGVWYPGQVLSFNAGVAVVRFMHPSANRGVYKWPSPNDEADVEIKFIFFIMDETFSPVPVAGGRLFQLPNWKGIHDSYVSYQRHYF